MHKNAMFYATIYGISQSPSDEYVYKCNFDNLENNERGKNW